MDKIQYYNGNLYCLYATFSRNVILNPAGAQEFLHFVGPTQGLGPRYPPIQRVPGSFPRSKSDRYVTLITHICLEWGIRMGQATTAHKHVPSCLQQRRPNLNFMGISNKASMKEYAILLPALCIWGGHKMAQLMEALRYKRKGRGFDCRYYLWNFSLT
jgi:hypothetical protein